MEFLSDGEIKLCLAQDVPADPARQWLRAQRFAIFVPQSFKAIGVIDFRIGYTLSIARFWGNIGYAIHPMWRGHHYAGKACKLIGELAKTAYGMDVLWLTCNPDNAASRKTCEWIGATLVEIVDVPPDSPRYQFGDRQKCRYRWIVY